MKTTKISISDFSFSLSGYGHYRVTAGMATHHFFEYSEREKRRPRLNVSWCEVLAPDESLKRVDDWSAISWRASNRSSRPPERSRLSPSVTDWYDVQPSCVLKAPATARPESRSSKSRSDRQGAFSLTMRPSNTMNRPATYPRPLLPFLGLKSRPESDPKSDPL